MIGLVLVSHGRLAEELRLAMEHVVGPQRGVRAVCIGADDDIEGRRAEIQNCIQQVDTGDGVVLLTDMFGGTPSNLAMSMMNRPGVEVIAGVNLPMLVKLAKIRGQQTIGECVQSAEAAGRKYIASASHVLEHCKNPNICATFDPRRNGGEKQAEAGISAQAVPAPAGTGQDGMGQVGMGQVGTGQDGPGQDGSGAAPARAGVPPERPALQKARG
jgi:PTS system mannose-specific IIA component